MPIGCSSLKPPVKQGVFLQGRTKDHGRVFCLTLIRCTASPIVGMEMKRRLLLVVIMYWLLMSSCSNHTGTAASLATVVRVIDGETIEGCGAGRCWNRVRLIGLTAGLVTETLCPPLRLRAAEFTRAQLEGRGVAPGGRGSLISTIAACAYGPHFRVSRTKSE